MTEAFKQTSSYRSSASNIICLIADQKAGKTCSLVDTPWPEGWKLYVHDIDGGFEYAKQIWDKRHDPANLTIKSVFTMNDLHEGLWSPPPGHNLYAIDTYTMAMKKFKVHLTPPADGSGLIPVTDWKKIGGKISGYAIDYFERWTQMVSKHGAWGIIICQEKREENEATGLSKIVPALIGQARTDVAATANVVLHLELQKKIIAGKIEWERVFRTRETPTCMAADRTGALDPIEPANLAAIIKKIETKRANK